MSKSKPRKKFLLLSFLFIVLILTTAYMWETSFEQAKNFQYPYKGKILHTPAGEVFYQQMGEGPDLLFVHGIGASLYIWQNLAGILAKDFRVTLIDLPGFGRSIKDKRNSFDLDSQTQNLYEIIQALKLDKPILVASSMGAAIGLWAEKTHPNTFGDMVLIAAATDPRLVPLPLYQWPWFSQVARVFLNKFVMRELIYFVVSRRDIVNDDRVFYSLKNMIENPDSLYIFFKATQTLMDARLPKELSGIQQNVLILNGEKDRSVPTSYAKDLSKVLVNSRVIVHPTGGHHLMEDEPQWVAKQIKKFLSDRNN